MNKLALITAAIAALSTSAGFASTPTKSECVTATKPVPVYVVNPTELPANALNQTVNVVMTIDAKGVPHDVRLESSVDARIARRLQLAVSQWRFQPEYVNGQAVTARVVLPITLGGESDGPMHEGVAQLPAIQAY